MSNTEDLSYTDYLRGLLKNSKVVRVGNLGGLCEEHARHRPPLKQIR